MSKIITCSVYTNDICKHWRFKTYNEAVISSQEIFDMYLEYESKDFVGMDMCRKFEMGFTEQEDIQNKMVESIKTESPIKKKIGRQ